jgi:hypothetical protein
LRTGIVTVTAPWAYSILNVNDDHRGIVGRLRGYGSNADLLVQGQAWYQFHHLASVWMERFELPTPGFQGRCAPVAPHPGDMVNMTRRVPRSDSPSVALEY